MKAGVKFAYSNDQSYSDLSTQYRTHWNNLHDLLSYVRSSLLGFNTPFQYYNTEKSMFGIHVDPMNFATLNLMYFGSSKLWLFVNKANADVINNYFKEHVNQPDSHVEECQMFYSHPAYVFDPWKVAKNISK
jgi:hypothetical protein